MTTTEIVVWDFAPHTEISNLDYENIVTQCNRNGRCYENVRVGQFESGEAEGTVGSWSCSLSAHADEQPHVALSHRTVLAVWGGAPPETTVDGAVEPFTPEVGVIYRFRNRDTLLCYVGPRGQDRVEVLDMTHQRYRVLNRDQLVPRGAGAEPPTPEQMQWVATFLVGRREEVRRNAITQRRNGYFRTSAELNDVLEELDLAPLQVRHSGVVTLEMRIQARPGMPRAEIERGMRAWMERELPEGISATEGRTHRLTANLDEVSE